MRRHTKWLYSVQPEALDGVGFAFTLTLLRCPATAGEWRRILRAFMGRLERAGSVRLHWVIEWQRRGVPHLHGCVYFAADLAERHIAAIYAAWLAVAAEYGAGFRSQDVQRIDGALGWLRYLSKHAARGVAHYQRQGKPAGWATTGRLWGRRGSWPASEPMRFDVDRAGGYRLRRMLRAWRLADARAALAGQLANPLRDVEDQERRLRQCRRRISSARRMLRSSDPLRARVRGASEWVDEGVSVALVLWLIADGHGVEQRVEVEG